MRHPDESPLVRFLRDPSRSLAHALSIAEHAAVRALPLALALVGLIAAALLALFLVAPWRARRLAGGARLVQLAVPPELEAEGALLLWSALHDLLRPRLARLLGGQPQLAWEIAADRGGSRFRLWIPGSVPPGLVERALAAAWPGITTVDLCAADADKDAPANREDVA